MPGDRVRYSCRGPLSASGLISRREKRTAIAADGGRVWSARRGAPSRGCAIFARRYGSSFEDHNTAKEPAAPELSRRYTEVLLENLGQPGFRELIIATLDVETRGDLVFAAIGEVRRQAYFQRSRGDLIDLSGVGRSQVFDAMAAAMSCAGPDRTARHRVLA